ncbi:cytidine deaminase [Puteibacter caeruleilacunae]|nr:cytidine deaminase [Puteibacter caeruleilacunae]
MKKVEITFSITEYEGLDELSTGDALLVEKARTAAADAYAPYSKFNVGAAILLDNGEIITGNNQENAAYPSGLCAERVALFYANAKFPESAVNAVAITASTGGALVENPVKPCGSCRQVLSETTHRFGKPIRLILDGSEKIQVVEDSDFLLPLSFNNDDLQD